MHFFRRSIAGLSVSICIYASSRGFAETKAGGSVPVATTNATTNPASTLLKQLEVISQRQDVQLQAKDLHHLRSIFFNGEIDPGDLKMVAIKLDQWAREELQAVKLNRNSLKGEKMDRIDVTADLVAMLYLVDEDMGVSLVDTLAHDEDKDLVASGREMLHEINDTLDGIPYDKLTVRAVKNSLDFRQHSPNPLVRDQWGRILVKLVSKSSVISREDALQHLMSAYKNEKENSVKCAWLNNIMQISPNNKLSIDFIRAIAHAPGESDNVKKYAISIIRMYNIP